MIGRTLGNYRIIEQIGMGGMATVYKAYDPDTDRYVAIKILPEHFSQDPKFRQRFEREAKAIAKLEHIHILPLFAYGEEGGTAYMVMRYLKAGSLTDRIRAGALSLTEASRLLSQVASALDHAHSHGVLHRDVKPSNILLDADGNAFLTDFGIAKMVESTLDLTGGGILGTPAYMSPEQCRGNQELTPASDQYSLGIILYEMITGRTPFQAETPIALIHMQLNDPLPMPHQVRADLPEEAERVILKALTKDPELRFPTCGAMAAAFARVVSQIPAAQLAEGDLTVGDQAPFAPTAAVVEDATVLHGAAEQAAARPKLRRGMPGWAWGAIGLVVILGLLATAIVLGWFLLGEDETTPVAEMRQTPVAGGEDKAEKTPTTPGEPASPEMPAVSAPVSPGEPPQGLKEVRPCDWQGHGSGLCIYEPSKEKPIRKILQNENFEFPGMAAWSPDGKRIAFTAVESGGSHDRDMTIYVVDTDGKNLVELPQLSNDLNPAWSPDGEWLVFHSGCDLGKMRPDGSEPKILWQHEADKCVEQAQWSPDSQLIVVSVHTDGGHEIWVTTDNEGAPFVSVATVTYQNDNCMSPDVAFSPNGKRVAYIDDKCQAWLANANGSGQPEPLPDFPYWWMASAYPQWGTKPPAGPVAAEIAGPKYLGLCSETDPGRLCIFDAETDRNVPIPVDLDLQDSSWQSWSPDGRQVVFDAGPDERHRLYVVNTDGSGLAAITEGATNDLLPIWSPASAWIAFHRNCELWRIRPDGTGAEMLAPHTKNSCAQMAGWSSDGRRLAFIDALYEESIPGKVWLINPDTKLTQQLYTFAPRAEPWKLAWSPDGRQIAIWYGEDGQEKIILLDVRSGESKPLSEAEAGQIGLWTWLSDYWPQWGEETAASAAPPAAEPPPPKPVGKWVETCPDTEPPQICVFDDETGKKIQFTADLTFESIDSPSWSPDSRQIAFGAGSNPERSQQYDHKLYVVNADGSGLTQITHGDTNDVSPAWSPDGEWIAFHRNCSLGLVHPDGAEAKILLEGSEILCVGWIAWSPDSQQISFFNCSDMAAQGELWLIDRDGGNPHVVYAFERTFWPWVTMWSPDGRQVGFWYYENDQSRIVLVNVDGSGKPQSINDQTVIDQKRLAHWLSQYWPQWGRQ
ncbi:MAG: protein kinase [Anaerolineae bacterium]|nr:protein kinase [Anaerolineae bacterium]